MDHTYFERLHQAEARQTEWRMLDEALQKRVHTGRSPRVVIGRWLGLIGARLAGEPVVWPLEASKSSMFGGECGDCSRYN